MEFDIANRALLGALATLCIGLASTPAIAVSPVIQINEAAAKADITAQGLRGGVSVLIGSGGNITVLETSGGKFLVDAGIAVSRPKLEAALAQLGPAPLKYVVDTHWHWDHTDGNAWMHEAGATIVAHPNTLRHLQEATRVDDWDYTFQPVPLAGRPTLLVSDSKAFDFAGNRIEVRNFGPGHTDGDLWVYFEKADVLALGDLFWNGVYPFIDNAHGGGIDDAIHWADEAVKRVTDKTIIVPGHGPVGNRAQLIEFRDMLASIRDNVRTLKRQGLSLEETVAAHPTAAFDDKWGHFIIDPTFFTRLVYSGVR